MPRSFRLVETLGEGSFGAVHLAEVEGAEGFVQRLAVKWLLPQWSHDGELLGRLRDEARLLALLNHDHVVRVHGLTRIGGRLAILMEAVDGVDLARLDGHPVPPAVALAIVESVADALDAAWQTVPPGADEPLRVVHRDIKPSNVMVTARGGVKVMDFGVARAAFEAREAQTRSQQFGTARYMAPERWLQGVADAPSDIFSLGITLIELVGGRPVERPRLAEDGFREDLGRALGALVDVPEVAALAAEMCAFDPSKRPSAAEVVARCRDLGGRASGPSLKEWAPSFVASRVSRRAPGDGSIVHEDVSGETFASNATLPLGGVEVLDATASAPVPTPVGVRPMEVVAAAPEGERTRWRALMGATVAAALTVLGLSGWQVMRARWDEGPAPAASDPAQVAPAPPVAVPAAEGAVAADTDAVASPAPQPPPVESAVEAPVTSAATVSPAPGPRPSVVEAPASEPPPSPVAPPAEPPVVVQFVFDPGWSVAVEGVGDVQSRRGVSVPRGAVLQVDVQGAGSGFRCTVKAEPSRSVVRIDGRARACR